MAFLFNTEFKIKWDVGLNVRMNKDTQTEKRLEAKTEFEISFGVLDVLLVAASLVIGTVVTRKLDHAVHDLIDIINKRYFNST